MDIRFDQAPGSSSQTFYQNERIGLHTGKCGARSATFLIRRPVDDEGDEHMLPGDETQFVQAHNGDHLITPFQCDLCHFRNVYKRDPKERKGSDLLGLRCIRRANLDALWAREPGTVAGNLSGAKRLHDIGTGILEIPSITLPMGPFSLEDKFGMGVAMTMLLRSLDAGTRERYSS